MKLSAQGSSDESLRARAVLSPRLGFGEVVNANATAAVRIEAARAGGERTTVEVGDRQVVELTLDGGVTLYLPPDEVAKMGERAERGGAGEPGGTPAVLEVRAHDVPFLVEDGQVFCRLRFFRTGGRPVRVYGEGRASSYQDQDLTLARCFKRASPA